MIALNMLKWIFESREPLILLSVLRMLPIALNSPDYSQISSPLQDLETFLVGKNVVNIVFCFHIGRKGYENLVFKSGFSSLNGFFWEKIGFEEMKCT